MYNTGLTGRTGSSYSSQHESRGLKPVPLFAEPQQKERRCAGRSGALEALLQVQAELKSLRSRIDKLRDLQERSVDAERKQHKELDEAVVNLDVGIASIRERTRIRFEGLEERLTFLDVSSVRISECCRSLKANSVVESYRDARAARFRLDRGLAVHEPEHGKRRKVEVKPSVAAGCSNRETEFEEHISKQSGLSTTPASRRRSRSPAPRAHDDPPDEQFADALSYRSNGNSPMVKVEEVVAERSLASYLPSAVALPGGSSAGHVPSSDDRARGRFVKPHWALGVSRQSRPLPECQDLAGVVRAFSASFRSFKVPTGQPINMASFVEQLLQLDPTMFRRHEVSEWTEFMPMVQRYVALFLILTPSHGDQSDWTEEVLLEGPAYYARPVNPPTFAEQRNVLSVQDHTLAKRFDAKVLKRKRKAEAEGQLASSHGNQRATTFPELWRPMTAEWTAHLAKPSSFFALVDTLRIFVKPNKEVGVRDIHGYLRTRLGLQSYYDILDACNGTNRFLELAAKHIKITKAAHDDGIILFHDAAFPFYKDADNEEYTAYSASDGTLPAQRSRSRSPAPREMRQWGKTSTPT